MANLDKHRDFIESDGVTIDDEHAQERNTVRMPQPCYVDDNDDTVRSDIEMLHNRINALEEKIERVASESEKSLHRLEMSMYAWMDRLMLLTSMMQQQHYWQEVQNQQQQHQQQQVQSQLLSQFRKSDAPFLANDLHNRNTTAEAAAAQTPAYGSSLTTTALVLDD